MNNFISVIVCSYNRERYIGQCLEHLHKQTIPRDWFEVIIVDNNSTDRTATICEEIRSRFPETNFRYVLEPSQGLSHARNRGIQEAKGTLVAFLDDDAFASQEYVEKLTSYFSLHEDVAAIGGKITPQYENEKPKWMSTYLLPLVAAQDLGSKPIPFPQSKFPIGANMAFRKEVFSRHGLFNVSLGRKGDALESGEEKDFFQRIKSAGDKIHYVPDIQVYHIIPSSRVAIDYIKRMALGIGKSERLRVSSSGWVTFLQKLAAEIFKAIGTAILFFGYLLQGKPQAGWMLVRFRYWVIKGFLFHT